MTTDAELIRAAHSDARAFRELYDRYAERVYRFHLGRTRDAHTAHDLTGETFAQAWLVRRAREQTRHRPAGGGRARPHRGLSALRLRLAAKESPR
jgi:RNA polymerase sigma-70 factor (ECF subfamily)